MNFPGLFVLNMTINLHNQCQQRVDSKCPNSTWRVIKDIEGVKSFLKFLRKMKKDERGTPRGAALDAQKMITNLRQFDDENGAQYIARATKLTQQEKELSSSHTSESEVVGFAIRGLKAGYNPLTHSWALDAVRDENDDGGANLQRCGERRTLETKAKSRATIVV